MKKYVRIFVAASAFLLALSSISMPVKAATTYGPRIDELLIKIYGTDLAEFAAFEASEIDLLDWPAGSSEVARWSSPPYSDTIVLDALKQIGMYQFDINNNETMLSYPNFKSPTSDPNFRHAIAHMVNKPLIISTYVGGTGVQLESPFMPWTQWYDPTMNTHPYSPAAACQILFDNGWRNSPLPPGTTVTKDRSTLTWSPGAVQAGWHGWWFRYNTEWFQFDFSNVENIGSNIDVFLSLSVANHASGEFGLDGLVDVIINPGSSPTITYTNVLLDNVDPNNLVYAHMDPNGSPRATAHLIISPAYVVGGNLAVQVVRHTDSNLAPTAPIGTNQPIVMTDPPTVPPGVYENDDAHTAHLYVWTEEGDGGSTVSSANGDGYVSLTYTVAPQKVHFPTWWPVISGGPNVAGLDLESVLINGPHGLSDPGLIFYRRSDIWELRMAGWNLIYATGLENIGIPVDDCMVPKNTVIPKVMYQKDFHISTGYWIFSRDPDYVYDLWHPDNYNPDLNEFAQNYNNVNDPLWNSYVKEGLKYATSITDALTASHAACQRFGEAVFFVPIWTTMGNMAHKKPWHVVNVDNYGVRHWWNLESIHNPDIGPTGGQLRWGFKSDVDLINPIFSQWQWDWQILDKLFDTLIKFNPLNIAVDMPWMANSWTVGTWTNPDTGRTASKISYTLRTDIKWINPITGTVNSAVTPEDVKFSFQYVYDHLGWNYPSVADIYKNPDGSLKIEISGNTVTFYESIASVWALHWLGGLPIIPKSVYEPIADPHGFYPGGIGTATLTGSGNFYFSSYVPGVSCLLTANRNYFKPIVPDIDTNPTTIKIHWGIFKSNVKSGDWTVNVLDLIAVAGALGWVGPPGGIPQDINKDGKVNVLDLIIVATNIGASW